MTNKTNTKSSPVISDPPPGFWKRDLVYHPEPIMPIHHSVFMAMNNNAHMYTISEFSVPLNHMGSHDIGGWAYIGVEFMSYDDPQLPVRINKYIENIRNDMEQKIGKLWYTEWKPAQKRRIKELQLVDLSRLSNSELADHISDVLKPFLEKSFIYQGMLEYAFSYALTKLTLICDEFLDDDPTHIIQLLAGLSSETTSPALRITKIARAASENPRLKTLLEQTENIDVKDIADIDPEFAAMINGYLDDYGCRVFHHMIHYPTLREKPSILFNLIRDKLIKGFQESSITAKLNKKRMDWLEKTRTKLKSRPEEDQIRFEKAWEGVMQIYPIKEECEYGTFDAPTALMRYSLLELGSRMTAGHLLDEQDDVFFLELEEAVQAIRANNDCRQLVVQRKNARVWMAAHPGPVIYGDPPLDPYGSYPDEAQCFIKAAEWVTYQYFGVVDTEAPESESRLTGIAASSGNYTGPVRIVIDESDFDKIRAGDVLVCPITTPSWSILFPNIGAIVTEAGGLLSHPAIIAREFGLPAVLTVRDAIQKLRDGQMVTVDGSVGTVEIH